MHHIQQAIAAAAEKNGALTTRNPVVIIHFSIQSLVYYKYIEALL